MAGDWIKMERGTPEKPEVLAITVRMGWDDPDLTVGKLFKLWCWFDQHTTDGNAVGVSPALLDRYLSAQGFINAVALSGWVVINDDGLSLPNFDKHNGASAKKRGLTAKRVANHKTNAETNAASVSETLGERYLEKRREEKSKQDKAPIVACPHIEILELYANILPSLPQPHQELWEGSARAKALRERWIWLLTTKKKTGERYATTKEEGLEWFGRFFAYVSASDFLMGRAGKWSCDLGWLVKAENFAKVMAGNFENKGNDA